MVRTMKTVVLGITLMMVAAAWAQNSSGKKAVANVAALQPVASPTAEKAKAATTDTPGGAPSSSTRPSADALLQYRIGEQDVLVITVWREPELSATVMVRPDGKITLPLVNDVEAGGLSTDELKTLLTEKLRPFVNLPQVTVSVREINSRKVFVIGQVAREGSYRINSNTTVLQIIAEAGGLRDFANRKGIYVLRHQSSGQVKLNFNYDKVIHGKDDNIQLRPGDTIVIP
jgi:polysaccharide biosynthesis/export protein